jgi:hypothetical protein
VTSEAHVPLLSRRLALQTSRISTGGSNPNAPKASSVPKLAAGRAYALKAFSMRTGQGSLQKHAAKVLECLDAETKLDVNGNLDYQRRKADATLAEAEREYAAAWKTLCDAHNTNGDVVTAARAYAIASQFKSESQAAAAAAAAAASKSLETLDVYKSTMDALQEMADDASNDTYVFDSSAASTAVAHDRLARLPWIQALIRRHKPSDGSDDDSDDDSTDGPSRHATIYARDDLEELRSVLEAFDKAQATLSTKEHVLPLLGGLQTFGEIHCWTEIDLYIDAARERSLAASRISSAVASIVGDAIHKFLRFCDARERSSVSKLAPWTTADGVEVPYTLEGALRSDPRSDLLGLAL